jgi:hypothetical protein
MLECLGIPAGFQEDDETEDQIGCPAQEDGCGRYRRHEYDLDRHLVSLRTQARAGSYSPDYGLVVSAVEDVAPRRDGMVWVRRSTQKILFVWRGVDGFGAQTTGRGRLSSGGR